MIPRYPDGRVDWPMVQTLASLLLLLGFTVTVFIVALVGRR